MRNVKRTAKPRCLTQNGGRWKAEFLDALKGRNVALKRRCRMRYNHKNVRQALNDMYHNYCCYCEGAVGPVGADQIEHRKPVDEFPEEAFEWSNLHLACAGCNRAKSNKWNK